MLRRLLRVCGPYVKWRRLHAYGYRRTFSEWRFARRILGRPPVAHCPTPELASVSLHTLCCQRDYLYCIWALRSLLRFMPGFTHVTIHLDKGVRATAIRDLTRQLPFAQLITWNQANEAIRSDSELSPCRRLLCHRDTNSTLAKIIDVPLLAPTERILFVDPDVFFFKDPVEVRTACLSSAHESFFQLDPVSNYSISAERAAWNLGVALPERLNSGLTLLHRDVYSAALFERLLQDPELNKPHTVMEQTLIALAAARTGKCHYWPSSYMISMEATSRLPTINARHYAGPSKQWIVSEALHILEKQGL